MRVLEPREIVQLLRAAVEKTGSQEAWAKRAGIDRTLVNKVLRGKKRPTKNMIRALGLRSALFSAHDSRVLEAEEVRRLLRTQVAQAGSLAAWGRDIGAPRPEISKALWGKRPPNKQMMDALGLRVVIVND
jgi:DNA-binding phage protein